MADKKITELTNITGANLVDADEFVVVDISADETKAITLGELKEAFDSGSGFVRITGDTMTGDLTVPNVVVSGNVDGRDVSADGTKLDTIETNADVTDTTNVTAAGALMTTGGTMTGGLNITSGNLGIGTSSPSTFTGYTNVTIKGGSNGSNLDFHNSSNARIGAIVSNPGTELIIETNEATPLEFKTNSTERMRITSSGSVGIGTSSPAHSISLEQSNKLGWVSTVGSDKAAIEFSGVDDSLRFYNNTGSTERLRINSSGNVGIGTSSVTSGFKLDVVGDARFSDVAGDDGVELGWSAGGSQGFVQVYDRGASAFRDLNLNNAVTITSTGNVGIGVVPTTDHNPVVEALQIGSTANLYGRNDAEVTALTSNSYLSLAGFPKYITTNEASEYTQSSGNHIWYNAPSGTAGASCVLTERMRLDASGKVGINTTTMQSTFNVQGVDGNIANFSYPAAAVEFKILTPTVNVIRLDTGTDDALAFGTSGTERLRITSAGSVGIGTSSPAAKLDIESSGVYTIYSHPTHGDIGAISATGDNIAIDGIVATSVSGIAFVSAAWRPRHNQATSDNFVDLGQSFARFDDVYATNGTIQTSDRNEKQDIAELSDAEQRVAVAAKGLLRKFRWRDAVADKGDEARTHFGIIAQDLQAAFAAEGLDAGDYAMFISSTWTDEETGEERTRMGVRYSELLAFIISAI